MAKLDLVDLAASGLDEKTNAIWVQCKGAPVSDEDAPDFGRAPFMQALGVSSRPAPATDKGNAQGVMAVGVCGYDGVCIGAHDNRCSSVFGEIKAGETAVHATGENFDSRILLKDQVIALICGNDMILTVDRKNGQIAMNCPGGTFKLSKDGVFMTDETGTAGIQIKGGSVFITGQVVLGGRVPSVPVHMGVSAGPGAPAVGVFIGT
jgi:hypothetical protein